MILLTPVPCHPGDIHRQLSSIHFKILLKEVFVQLRGPLRPKCRPRPAPKTVQSSCLDSLYHGSAAQMV